MGDIANQGEAERCRDMAKEFLSRGDFEKAAKFFDKSLRLYPLPGVEALKQKAETLLRSRANGASHAQSSGSSSQRHGSSGTSHRPSPSSSSGSSSRNNHSSSSSSSSGGGAGTSGSSSSPRAASSGSSTASSASSASGAGGGTASGGGDVAGTGANNRPYTPEQESGAARVVLASKKCYYETLSVSRTADESEIKRAYKKLALRFHPDKNAAPSAEAAFKAINAAVETLSDASKRRMYDQLGHEGATSAAASGGGAGGGGPFGGGGFHGGNMHEFTPEDMFNMFFNGGAFGNTGGGFRTYSFGPGMRRRAAAAGGRRGGGTAEEDQQAQGGLNTLFNLLPVFLLLLSMSGLFSGSGDAAWQRPYSIHQTPPYSVPRYTASYGVTKDIPYFVTTNFQPSKSDLRRVEAQVEVEFKNDLHMKCDRQKRQKNKQLSEAIKRQDEAKRSAAESLETPACDDFFKKYKFKANMF